MRTAVFKYAARTALRREFKSLDVIIIICNRGLETLLETLGKNHLARARKTTHICTNAAEAAW
jgi:hypothetical protein